MSVSLRLLRRHVVESNLIEDITSRIGPHYDSHFAIAKAIAKRPLNRPVMNPCVIHRALSRGTEMEGFGGCVRNCYVSVGRYATPEPGVLPQLLELWWEDLVDTDRTAHELSVEHRELMAMFYHNWFLLIHPFRDGNGRTSRLFLNMLRLRWDLPWLIINDAEKWRYYAEIAHQGNVWFRKEYPTQIYPTNSSGRVIADPGAWWQYKSLSEIYEALPIGLVPIRTSVRHK